MDAQMKIFVSSTYEDLEEYRLAVHTAIRRLGHQPIGMEYFGSRPTEPKVAALEELEKCEAFVGIYAHRYGTIPQGDQFSVTEQEFDRARSLNLPCLCYRLNPSHQWPPQYVDHGASQEKLGSFLRKVDKLTRSVFTTPDNLAAAVSADLGRELDKATPRRTGTPVHYPSCPSANGRDSSWNRNEKIAIVGLVFVILTCVAAYLAIPGISTGIGQMAGFITNRNPSAFAPTATSRTTTKAGGPAAPGEYLAVFISGFAPNAWPVGTHSYSIDLSCPADVEAPINGNPVGFTVVDWADFFVSPFFLRYDAVYDSSVRGKRLVRVSRLQPSYATLIVARITEVEAQSVLNQCTTSITINNGPALSLDKYPRVITSLQDLNFSVLSMRPSLP